MSTVDPVSTKSASYLTIIDIAKPCPTYPPAGGLAMEFKYPLDPFQQYAVSAIDSSINILVSAKTGSGKTLPGEYACAQAIARGGRAFFTTPIKSLSNQKFHDLKVLFGEDKVGIMTGDIKFQPHAAIVVMTTEILHDLLYKRNATTKNLGISTQLSLDGLHAVIFDECHYFNDTSRGKIWEETMIMLPSEIIMVMLSATMGGAETFATWLGNLKQTPIHLIQTSHRVVPLIHYVPGATPDAPFRVVMDASNKFNTEVYQEWLRSAGGNKGGPGSYTHTLNQTMRRLERDELLPALAFIFSRKECERYAAALEGSFLTGKESADVRNTATFHLRHHRANLEKLEQYHTIMALLERGIAFHHSGLLPLLKEIVELLFSRGLVKILMCTETFAVGINMPTKTVVFTGYRKYDDSVRGLRTLSTGEYLQMAGRAGRRGMDKIGTVLCLPSREPSCLAEARTMMTGNMSTLESQMDFHYEFVLKALQAGSGSAPTETDPGTTLQQIMRQSFWCSQRMDRVDGLRVHAAKLRRDATALADTMDPIYARETAVHAALAETIRTTTSGGNGNGQALKEARQAMNVWTNKHIGPAWKKALDIQKTTTRLESEAATAEKDAANLVTDMETPVRNAIQFLSAAGYLTDAANDVTLEELSHTHLTKVGVLATEINQGHPLLMAEMYASGTLAELSADEIVAVLATFIDDKVGDSGDDALSLNDLHAPTAVCVALSSLDVSARRLSDLEYKMAASSDKGAFWVLSLDWIDVIYRWVQGEEACVICKEYGVFTGNLMRAVLKMANIVEEWQRLATFTKDVPMLDKMKDVSNKLVRDIAVPDSLYLRI